MINISKASDIQPAINDAKAGDTIAFASGQYVLTTPITVKTGITMKGAANFGSQVKFQLPTPGCGIILPGGCEGFTYDGTDTISSSGIFKLHDGKGYGNITIIGNKLQFGGGNWPGGSTNVFGIDITVPNSDLNVTYNLFHDSMSSNRNYEIWNSTRAMLCHNESYNVVDGGHLDEPQDGCQVSYNFWHNIHRMGQEIQGNTPSNGLQVVGNMYRDLVNPYYDSFGLSVVNDKANNTMIAGNDIRFNFAPGSGWGNADSGGTHRCGYGIETGGANNTVELNTIVAGLTVASAICSSTVSTAKQNKVYGSYLWSIIGGEGSGTYSNKATLNSDNTIDSNVAHAPAIPTNNFAGPAYRPGATAPNPPTPPVEPPAPPIVIDSPVIAGLKVEVVDEHSVKLTWTDALASAGTVTVISTGDGKTMLTEPVAVGDTHAVLIGLHSGWSLSFQVVAGTAKSDAVTILMPGVSTAPQPVASAQGGGAIVSD